MAAGKRADLLLLDANPLEATGNLALQDGVMLGGRWFPEETLRAGLPRRAP